MLETDPRALAYVDESRRRWNLWVNFLDTFLPEKT